MKQKLLLSAFIILCCTATTTAQITKGTVWLGGFINFNGSNNDGEAVHQKNSSIAISPAIGRVIKDNLVVGIELDYYHTKSEYTPSTNNYTSNEYGAGLFIRKYIPVVNRFYIYAHGNVDGSYITTKRYGDVGKGWAATLGLHPGASFAVNKKLQLESGFNNLFYVRYSKLNFPEANGTETKQEAYNAGISLENGGQFYLGFRFLLPG